MILSRPLQNAMRGVGRNALDLPVAGFAAVAVAFLAFAMPADLMTDLVGASGLPSILPAAEPPLGFKARIGVGLIGAAGVFGLVFALLRLLDRTGYDSPRAKAAAKAEPEEPRARRRDFHPDAPAPRPISAAREFGEPAPPAKPVPLWLDTAEPEAAVLPEPEPKAAPEPAPAPLPAPEVSASLAELMARLERGLERRVRPASAPPSPVMPQVFQEANDDRLQSAIDSLQRLAARHS